MRKAVRTKNGIDPAKYTTVYADIDFSFTEKWDENITEYTEDGSVTGIRSIPSVHDNDIYYNMNGQRVNQPTRGIYIKNGKKVFVE